MASAQFLLVTGFGHLIVRASGKFSPDGEAALERRFIR